MDLAQAADSIRTRQDLAQFVLALHGDLLTNRGRWENQDLERFLEAMAAWISDMDGYFLNQGIAEPERPSWGLVGQMLLAASMYE
jgi:hypothetical protein